MLVFKSHHITLVNRDVTSRDQGILFGLPSKHILQCGSPKERDLRTSAGGARCQTHGNAVFLSLPLERQRCALGKEGSFVPFMLCWESLACILAIMSLLETVYYVKSLKVFTIFYRLYQD